MHLLKICQDDKKMVAISAGNEAEFEESMEHNIINLIRI